MDNYKHIISQEVLDRYVRGQASLEEIALVTMAIKEDDDFRNLVDIMEQLQQSGTLKPEDDIPMASMAAMSEGNLCDVLCEQYILTDYLGAEAAESYTEEALDNCWLKESGTPLHNMGRLLEKNGMTVSRKYDCTTEELIDNLARHYKIIAVVDYGQLRSKESDGIFHAVICLSVTEGIIRIYDPAIDGHSNYSMDNFVKAWHYSRNYLVCASAEGLEYLPHPIDVSDIDLDEDLMELSEAIAENAHEIWADKRYKEGWRYGPQRDDVLLQHPDMIPYSELTEGEKYYDRDMALNTIRLVRKLGFNITRKYTLYCSRCGELLADTMSFCPNCGTPVADTTD